MEVAVSKYGGDTIRFPEDITKIKQITLDDPRRRIIVVSARGKVRSTPKLTDMLIDHARKPSKPSFQEIVDSSCDLCERPDREKIADELWAVTKKRDLLPPDNLTAEAYEDALNAFGEDLTARIVAEQTGFEYVPSRELFLVTNEPRKARILPKSKDMIRRRLSDPNKIYVVPGCQGCTEEGNVLTFGRNKSDLTGAFIVNALDGVLYEIFKAKNGVLEAQPEFVDDPGMIETITFKEMRDLSYSGFNVLDPSAIEHVEEKGIPVHIRGIPTYPNNGTYVLRTRILDPKRPIIGIAYKKGFCVLKIDRTGLNDMVGILVDVLTQFRNYGISVEHVPTGIDDVSVVFGQDQISDDLRLDSLVREIQSLVGERGNVSPEYNVGCSAIAGGGLADDYEVSPTIPITLKEAGIKPVFPTEGVSRSCIIYGFKHSDGPKAVRLIYEKYLREKARKQ